MVPSECSDLGVKQDIVHDSFIPFSFQAEGILMIMCLNVSLVKFHSKGMLIVGPLPVAFHPQQEGEVVNQLSAAERPSQTPEIQDLQPHKVNIMTTPLECHGLYNNRTLVQHCVILVVHSQRTARGSWLSM